MKKILLNGVDGNFGGKSAKVLLERYPHEDLIFTAPTEKGLEKKVTLVDMIPVENFGRGGAKFNQIALMDMLKHKEIRMIGEVKLATQWNEIGFENLEGGKVEIPYDNLILSLGVCPNQKKIEEFSKVNKEVIFIGDCITRIGTLFHAVHTGHEAASVL